MHEPRPVTRRSLLAGAGAVAVGATGLAGVAQAGRRPRRPRSGYPPLWQQAWQRGIVFGSSIATWQLDADYPALHAREAGLLFTEDDLLWYQLKPSPDAPLNFGPGDQIIGLAEQNEQLVIAAHLAWDEGFGEGWTEDDLWGLTAAEASDLLYGVIHAEVAHYRGRADGWIVANEVTDPFDADANGFRTNVPWYATIGSSYIAESFHIAHQEDPGALLLINEFGFETVNEFGDQPGPRRQAYLTAIDTLLDDDVPVQAVGIQGHLLADRFATRFNENAYRAFLGEIADRGLPILITELDVLDDGLPAAIGPRDQKVADVYRRYLDVTLDEEAVKVVVAFGLTDRYTWLEEDQPRPDGAPRRPLAFDDNLQRKPAADAISAAFAAAPCRDPLWTPPRVP
ncbi:endo-1,4-beta-xylanase [Jiangella anatolica]|uniref:endo-1,4-beta-xylanase n=1 Tax=Jiangella anatolica TaxID=2670374 RepID=A0A2W2BQ71_9ACTN|nr:endo-1,4-beta-xylanase [Jiangella anatolica]PZF82504.1 hypothetical protein C1I92_16400 [Jiangella anatolica]